MCFVSTRVCNEGVSWQVSLSSFHEPVCSLSASAWPSLPVFAAAAVSCTLDTLCWDAGRKAFVEGAAKTAVRSGHGRVGVSMALGALSLAQEQELPVTSTDRQRSLSALSPWLWPGARLWWQPGRRAPTPASAIARCSGWALLVPEEAGRAWPAELCLAVKISRELPRLETWAPFKLAHTAFTSQLLREREIPLFVRQSGLQGCTPARMLNTSEAASPSESLCRQEMLCWPFPQYSSVQCCWLVPGAGGHEVSALPRRGRCLSERRESPRPTGSGIAGHLQMLARNAALESPTSLSGS